LGKLGGEDQGRTASIRQVAAAGLPVAVVAETYQRDLDEEAPAGRAPATS